MCQITFVFVAESDWSSLLREAAGAPTQVELRDLHPSIRLSSNVN